MTRDEAILTFMRTEGNNVAAGHGPTDEELLEANRVLDWFEERDGKLRWKEGQKPTWAKEADT